MWNEKPYDAGALAQLPALAFVNHLLRAQPWARKRLGPFSGKTVLLHALPFAVAATIQDDGTLTAAARQVPPDATLSAAPGVLLRILASDPSAQAEVAATGETALASELAYVARNLRWDLEEDLSRWLGDIPAHRLARAAQQALTWPGGSLSGLARTWLEYWTEEQPVLAKATQIRGFVREVDDLRDRTERLEKRLERLASK